MIKQTSQLSAYPLMLCRLWLRVQMYVVCIFVVNVHIHAVTLGPASLYQTTTKSQNFFFDFRSVARHWKHEVMGSDFTVKFCFNCCRYKDLLSPQGKSLFPSVVVNIVSLKSVFYFKPTGRLSGRGEGNANYSRTLGCFKTTPSMDSSVRWERVPRLWKRICLTY